MSRCLDYRFFQLKYTVMNNMTADLFVCLFVYNLELKSLGEKVKHLHMPVIHTLQCGSNTNGM